MDVFVCPQVRHDDIARVLLHIGEGIEYVGEFLGRDELWRVFATVDTPVTGQEVNSRLHEECIVLHEATGGSVCVWHPRSCGLTRQR